MLFIVYLYLLPLLAQAALVKRNALSATGIAELTGFYNIHFFFWNDLSKWFSGNPSNNVQYPWGVTAFPMANNPKIAFFNLETINSDYTGTDLTMYATLFNDTATKLNSGSEDFNPPLEITDPNYACYLPYISKSITEFNIAYQTRLAKQRISHAQSRITKLNNSAMKALARHDMMMYSVKNLLNAIKQYKSRNFLITTT